VSLPGTSIEALRRAFAGRQPIVYLVTAEEDRALRLLGTFAGKLSRDAELPVVSWSAVSGFGDESEEQRTLDPLAAVRRVQSGDQPGIWVLHDLPAYFSDPRLVRALREAYATLSRQRDRYLVVTATRLQLPQELEKQVSVVELGVPEEAELQRLVESYGRSYGVESLDGDLAAELSFALRGLGLQQASHTLHRVFRRRGQDRETMLAEIFRDRSEAVRQAGFLEFVPPQASVEHIGGLENLKDWLERRRTLFSKEAIDAGLPSPRGMLIMGMSGCGKSLAAKAVSTLWRVPLYRLDMNLVASGLYGTPEAAFDRALHTIEALAPAVLWIDEIENGLGMDEEVQSGNPRVFASFLTWMQEKPPLIFVAATANRISALPAEVIRKGRFDQVFFVDLPTERERRDIFAIHIERNGGDPAAFDLELLSIATRGWNGAEIEQAVVSARIDAYNEGRDFAMADVTRNTSTNVPLSKTMHEQMKRIRGWAFGRAMLASSEKYVEVDRGVA
jgi:hypothetical protein